MSCRRLDGRAKTDAAAKGAARFDPWGRTSESCPYRGTKPTFGAPLPFTRAVSAPRHRAAETTASDATGPLARGGDASDLCDRRAALADLLEAVVAQAAHAAAHRDLGDPVGAGALDGQRADLLGELHDLVDPDAALVAAAAAAPAADGLVGLEVGVR